MSQEFCSGFYIPSEKQSFFILVFEEVLLNNFKILIVFGPTREDNCCEVKFINTGGNESEFPYNSNMAKDFLKRNQHIMFDRKVSNRKSRPSEPEVIDLVDDHSRSKTSMVVDLTEAEPELIVLDETIDQLNSTINNLNDSFSNINVFNLDKINVNNILPYKRKRFSFAGDVQVLNVKTNKAKQKSNPSSRSTSLNNSKVPVLNSKKKSKKNSKKNKKNKSSSNDSLIVQINNSGLRSVQNSTQKKALKRKNSSSESSKGSKKKRRKLQDVSNIQSHPNSPRNKPLTRNVADYYSTLNNAVQNINSKKNVSKSNKVQKKQNSRKSPKRKLKKRQDLPCLEDVNYEQYQNYYNRPTVHQNYYSDWTSLAETNIFNPNPHEVDIEGLRPVAIDGSNIARGHGKGQFSVKGLQICADYFANRGHTIVKVFLPRTLQECFSTKELEDLKSKCDVIFTPSQLVNGVRRTSYDDRFIVQYAHEFGGVIVSTDCYRDLLAQNPRWRYTIENRLLMFTWVDDFLMFPMDPLGKQGPSLEQFLRF